MAIALGYERDKQLSRPQTATIERHAVEGYIGSKKCATSGAGYIARHETHLRTVVATTASTVVARGDHAATATVAGWPTTASISS